MTRSPFAVGNIRHDRIDPLVVCPDCDNEGLVLLDYSGNAAACPACHLGLQINTRTEQWPVEDPVEMVRRMRRCTWSNGRSLETTR